MQAIKRLFRIFDEGAIFKWIVVALFALAAVLALLNAVIWDYQLLRMLRHATFFRGVGLVVLAAGVFFAYLIQIVVLLFRGAYEVSQIKQPRYSLLSLFAKALRASSESFLFFLLVLSPAACLATWVGGAALVRQLPMASAHATGGAFLAGLIVLVLGFAVALGQLFVSYFLAELIELLPAIAGDVAAIRQSKNSGRARGAS